jgi:hypothetical protein
VGTFWKLHIKSFAKMRKERSLLTHGVFLFMQREAEKGVITTPNVMAPASGDVSKRAQV